LLVWALFASLLATSSGDNGSSLRTIVWPVILVVHLLLLKLWSLLIRINFNIIIQYLY
jgi:hypothetical protein